MTDDLAYRIGKMRLAPGDVLVVKCTEQLRPETMARLREQFAELNLGVRTLVIDTQTDLAVLTRDEIEARIDEAA